MSNMTLLARNEKVLKEQKEKLDVENWDEPWHAKIFPNKVDRTNLKPNVM